MQKMKTWYESDANKYCGAWKHCVPCCGFIGQGFLGCCDCTQSGSTEWQYSWVGCCEDPALCFMGCCCCTACELYSQTVAAMQGVDKDENCLIGCGICCYAPCCVPCYHSGVRQAMRKKYDLKGTPCCDTCASCMWMPCLVCQEAREMGYRKQQRHVPWSFMGQEANNKVGGWTNAPTHVLEVVGNKTTELAQKGVSAVRK